MEYFNINEFDSPDEIGSGCNMDSEFLNMIQAARRIANIPFKITSGYRTSKRNLSAGGVKGSSHLSGLAADISVTNSKQRSIIVNACIEAGFTRIGIANSFIHIDNDSSKTQNVIWVY